MTAFADGDRYVALGSSFAAGPGLRPRSPGSPRRAGRSSINYAHLLARRLQLDLTDVSYSGATAAQIVDGRPGRPAQLEAVTASTRLVTITCGGNDVGYLPRLMLASLPRPVRMLPVVQRRIAAIGESTDARCDELGATLDRLLEGVHRRAPHAPVVLTDYLTILPPEEGTPTDPLPAEVAAWGRRTAQRLTSELLAAAERAGCGYLPASVASRDHHAWAPQPWTTRFHLSLRGGAPYHPNPAGMLAVADLVSNSLGSHS